MTKTTEHLIELDLYCRTCETSIYKCDAWREEGDRCCPDCSHYSDLQAATPVAPMGSGHECGHCGRRVDVDNDGSWVHDHNGDPACPEEHTP